MKKQVVIALGVVGLIAAGCSKSQPQMPPTQPPKTECQAGDNTCPMSKTDATKPLAPEAKSSVAPKAEAPAIVQQPAPAAPAILTPEKKS